MNQDEGRPLSTHREIGFQPVIRNRDQYILAGDECRQCSQYEQTTDRLEAYPTGIDRRSMLFGSAAAVVSVIVPGFGATVFAAQRADYPRRVIGKLSMLKNAEPLAFRYPWDHPQCECVLLRLAESAGGGIGPEKSFVAFHTLCTHMGAAIPATAFHGKLGIAGPCPLHLTTFDLTKHGMVVSGHATQGLPQVLLELDGDDIIATGVLGLLYGLSDNRIPLGKGH